MVGRPAHVSLRTMSAGINPTKLVHDESASPGYLNAVRLTPASPSQRSESSVPRALGAGDGHGPCVKEVSTRKGLARYQEGNL